MHSLLSSFRLHTERLLRIDPDTKPEVYLQVFESSEFADLNYWLALLFSAGIATLGLVLNSPAVVIGAMLISPLMGPILAAGLALAAGDMYLGIKSLVAQVASVAVAVAVSGLLVHWLPFHVVTAEIAARTKPNLLDLGIALLSGLAGSVFVARGRSTGATTALPGVAIAVALMPPLCTIGFGAGSGFDWDIIAGAGLLFLTNLAAIVSSAFVVFFLIRMDFPEVRQKADFLTLERMSRDRLYRMLQSTRFSRTFGDIGKLRWRVLMLAFVLVLLYAPLKKGLIQVRDEAVTRAAVNDALRHLGRSASIVSQQVEWTGSGPIRLRLISAEAIPEQKVEQAEQAVRTRTGRETRITVRQVASQEQLATLRAELAQPAPPPAAQDLDALRREVLSRINAPLKSLWPSQAAELAGYEFGFADDGDVLRIRYRAAQPLLPPLDDILAKALGEQLGLSKLRVVLENVTPPPAPARGPKHTR